MAFTKVNRPGLAYAGRFGMGRFGFAKFGKFDGWPKQSKSSTTFSKATKPTTTFTKVATP